MLSQMSRCVLFIDLILVFCQCFFVDTNLQTPKTPKLFRATRRMIGQSLSFLENCDFQRSHVFRWMGFHDFPTQKKAGVKIDMTYFKYVCWQIFLNIQSNKLLLFFELKKLHIFDDVFPLRPQVVLHILQC